MCIAVIKHIVLVTVDALPISPLRTTDSCIIITTIVIIDGWVDWFVGGVRGKRRKFA